MSLFGTSRDVSLIRHINRELINNIIEQQVGYYKINLEKTKINIYGESNGQKMYNDPVLINCLVERSDRITSVDEFGPDFNKLVKFRFLKDDLAGRSLSTELGPDGRGFTYNIVPEIGDIILWNEGYYEVDGLIENQLFVGKDPDYSYSDNNTNFGNSLSVICSGHYVRPERLGIKKDRL